MENKMSEVLTGDVWQNNAFKTDDREADAIQDRKSKSNSEHKLSRDTENKKKMISKHIQVDFKDDLPDGEVVFDIKHETYWQELAESKRVELEHTLEENQRLCKLREKLINENILYQKLLDEVDSFVEVLKDLIQDSPDNSGIDVRDVSDSNDE